MKNKLILGNQKGVALGYVLMSLVCVSAISALVLNMAKKEVIDGSLRSSSESARFAATAGLTYATNFFTNMDFSGSDEALVFLQSWYNKKNGSSSTAETWVAGGDNSYLDTNGMKFRVKVISVDFDEMTDVTDVNGNLKAGKKPSDSKVTILFESEARDKSGSRAKNWGAYTITGFESKGTPSTIPTNALYLGGGNMQIHAPVTINGDTYIGNYIDTNQAIYHSASVWYTLDQYSYYNGDFRMYQGNATKASDLARERFRGKAYFQGGGVNFTDASGPTITFEKSFGGTAKFTGTQVSPSLSSGTSDQRNLAVLAGGWDGSYRLNLGSNTELHYLSSAFSSTTFYTGSPSLIKNDYTKLDPTDILNLLEMDTKEPPACQINLDAIPESSIYTNISAGSSLNGDDLQNLYNNNSIPKYKDWLVIRIGSNHSYSPLRNGGNFRGRAIIIHQAAGSGTFGLPTVASGKNGGIILLYIPPAYTGNTADFNSITGSFRGMFYNASNTRLTLSAATTEEWTINGALYNTGKPGETSSNSLIRLGGSTNGRIVLNYDLDALEELAELGVITMDGESTENLSFERIPEIVLPAAKTELLGRSF